MTDWRRRVGRWPGCCDDDEDIGGVVSALVLGAGRGGRYWLCRGVRSSRGGNEEFNVVEAERSRSRGDGL